ncbi:MAG: zinc ribbon domain-containing protein [Anaerolineae bacterium]
MTVILMALLVFAVILAIGYPLVNAELYQYEAATNGDERLEGLTSQRSAVFDALRDLKFDYDTGKLSEHDYQQMKARYDLKAAEVLQKMDALAAAQAKRGNGSAKKAAAGAGKATCPKCNARVLADDRFCPTCGNKLVSA